MSAVSSNTGSGSINRPGSAGGSAGHPPGTAGSAGGSSNIAPPSAGSATSGGMQVRPGSAIIPPSTTDSSATSRRDHIDLSLEERERQKAMKEREDRQKAQLEARHGGLNQAAKIVKAKLEKAVRNSLNKKVLHLGYASIGADSIDIVIRHMRLHGIVELDLRCNGLTPDALVILSHCLHHDRIPLQKLGLKLNHIGKDGNTRGVEAMSDALCMNTRLEYLDLRYNRLNDLHMPSIKRLIEGNRHIRTLFLSWNSDITNVGGKMIQAAMRNNYTIDNLQLHHCRITEEVLENVEKKVQKNRETVAVTDEATGVLTFKSKNESPEDRAKILEDPCVKKVRMLGNLQHICSFLETLQVKTMKSKMSMFESEDKEKMLNHAGMEKEASQLQEILQLEELVVQFSLEKQEVERELSGYLSTIETKQAKVLELEQKRNFFSAGMRDRIKSLQTLKELEYNKCTKLQETSYQTRVDMENEEKENSRLRLYLQRCKDDIDKQFPKPTEA